MSTIIHRWRSDEALIQAYAGGDAAAFECLYLRHKDGLFAFLYRHYPRQAVVEELAQEAWLVVINGAGNWREEARFRTWLYRIAHNKLVDFWRRRDNNAQPLDSAPEPVGEAEDTPGLVESVMAAVGDLPQEQRDVLLLHEQGFSRLDIARITDASEETVKSRLRYARRHLRELLGDTL